MQEQSSNDIVTENREKVFNFINSFPSGKVLSIGDICEAAGVARGSSTYFINRLIREGHIKRNPVPGGFGYSWEVIGSAQVIKRIPVNAVKLKGKDRKRVADFREELAKEYIRNHLNVKMTMREIAEAANVPKNSASFFVQKLVREGTIIENHADKRGHSTWSLPLEGKLVDAPVFKGTTATELTGTDKSLLAYAEPTEEMKAAIRNRAKKIAAEQDACVEPQQIRGDTFLALARERAKAFAWHKNSDSLRDFIAWLNEFQG